MEPSAANSPDAEKMTMMEKTVKFKANIRRMEKLQDDQTTKIQKSLKTANALETARCLYEIEKACRDDYNYMIQIANSKGNENVRKIANQHTAGDKKAWNQFKIDVMSLQHGMHYLDVLCDALEKHNMHQGTLSVYKYMEHNQGVLDAVELMHEASGADMRRAKSKFIYKWITGLTSTVGKESILIDYKLSQSKDEPTSIRTIMQHALAAEGVQSEQTQSTKAPNRSATSTNHYARSDGH
jgi:hypothetical protein